MSTYHKTIVAYCATIIAALALYYVAFGALSDRLLNELNVKDKFAYLVSDFTALLYLTVIACAVGHCCSVVINHLVCVRNNERRIRAERAEVDAQVSEAQQAIAEAMLEEQAESEKRRKRREELRKEAVRREFGGDGLTVEVGKSAPERDAQAEESAEVTGLSSEPFPKRGSEAWQVGNEPVSELVQHGRMSTQEFREQYMTDVDSASDFRLTYFQIADLVMWWLNLNTGYASRNDVLCAIRSLVAYGMITTREGDWFISCHRSICNLKPHN